MSLKRIEVMDTSFRDGFQSVYGARVLTDDFLPALEAAVEAGITHFEVGGGARFQSLFFYCNENAFTMMDRVRSLVGPEINLQSLARGVNVVGLESQPRDIIQLHARMFKKHGMTTIRNFDALNDPNNIKYSAQCIHENGLKHEVVISLMDLPPGCEGAHDVAFYKKTLEAILAESIPFDSLCLKDASGTTHPNKVKETVKMAKEILSKDIPVRYHTHETAGVSIACYLAALEGGADAIDLARKPVSGGTAQPDFLTMIHALKHTQWDLGLDEKKILRSEEVFQECMKDYFLPPEALEVQPIIIFSALPGGALTANTQMMRDNGTLDRFPQVIAAMEDVIRKGGFGTSVTPVSQFYFQQAFNNIIFGPWERISEGYGKMVLGYYGKTPVKPDEKIIELASQQLGLAPTTKLVIDMQDEDFTKGIQAAKETLKKHNLEETDENIFIVASCKEKGIQFLLGNGKVMVRKNIPKELNETKKSSSYNIELEGVSYNVSLTDSEVTVNGKTYPITVQPTGSAQEKDIAPSSTTIQSVQAPMAGQVLKILKRNGDMVREGDVVFMLEAMKMEIEVKTPYTGKILAILTQVGDSVYADQKLMEIQ
ncbi:MAG TPA: biotin attachment protein [Caldisericia bacterium]|nr:biotin attachment protein [Caldisericia bacterium]HXK51112.1 biotin attachment protein [Caldisericia bacterium]